jgi:predicted site-specific integrase-resolvase
VLTLDEATDLTGIPRATLRTWQRRGEIKTSHDSRGRVVVDGVSLYKRALAWEKPKQLAA